MRRKIWAQVIKQSRDRGNGFDLRAGERSHL
jgi:hypothetical protein